MWVDREGLEEKKGRKGQEATWEGRGRKILTEGAGAVEMTLDNIRKKDRGRRRGCRQASWRPT